jgi:hypothetical protein
MTATTALLVTVGALAETAPSRAATELEWKNIAFKPDFTTGCDNNAGYASDHYYLTTSAVRHGTGDLSGISEKFYSPLPGDYDLPARASTFDDITAWLDTDGGKGTWIEVGWKYGYVSSFLGVPSSLSPGIYWADSRASDGGYNAHSIYDGSRGTSHPNWYWHTYIYQNSAEQHDFWVKASLLDSSGVVEENPVAHESTDDPTSEGKAETDVWGLETTCVSGSTSEWGGTGTPKHGIPAWINIKSAGSWHYPTKPYNGEFSNIICSDDGGYGFIYWRNDYERYSAALFHSKHVNLEGTGCKDP